MDNLSRRQVATGLAALPLAGCVGTPASVTASGDFMQINGRRLHYVVAGDGPPVILIHGASGNLLDWTYSMFDKLAENHRVLAVDRPGLGFSDPAPVADDLFSQADVINAAARQLGFGASTIVGHSYGGSVSLAYALNHPGDVSGLLLLAAPSHVWPGSVDRLYRITNTPVLGPIFSNIVPLVASDNLIASAIDGIFAPQATPPGYVAFIRPELALRPPVYRRNAAQVGALKETLRRMEPRYTSLKMPIELIHGTADTTVWLDIHSVPFAQKVANARLTRLEGVGHMPHHTNPDVVQDSIARLSA